MPPQPSQTAPVASALAPGTLLGKFRLIQRLAVGGMAEIYLAQVAGLAGFEKIVVLKRILPQLAAQPAFVQMFLDEARLAATLDHPNIVQVTEVGEIDGDFFIAMEYLSGETVRSLMRAVAARAQKLPLEQALYIVISVCQALHYAHEMLGPDGAPANIVHRDISPHNLMVTFDGAVKLLDFGIAKASMSTSVTRSGTIKGKIGYMSPEQCVGEPLDRRSDLFAVGVILWELTLGRRLFMGSSDFERMRLIVEAAIPAPHDLDPHYNPALEAIVMRCLERDPAKRYETARALGEHLEWLVKEERLYVAASGLQGLMGQLFAAKIEAQQAARRSGRSLVEIYQALPVEHLGGARTDDDSEEQSAFVPERRESRRENTNAPAVPRREITNAPAMPAMELRPSLPRSTQAPSLARAHRRLSGAWIAIFVGAVAAAITLGLWSQLRPRAVDASRSSTVASVPSNLTPPRSAIVAPDSPPPPPPAPVRSPIADVPVPVAAAPPPGPPATAAPTVPAPSPEPPDSASANDDGKLVLATSPWCNVVIDGHPRGVTPLSLHLPAGKHSLLLTNPEKNIRKSLRIEIKSNRTLRKRISLGR